MFLFSGDNLGYSDEDLVALAVSKANLDPSFAKLLDLYGVRCLSDISLIDETFVDTLESQVQRNAFKGRVDLTTYSDQITYLGFAVRPGHLCDYETTFVDRYKLISRLPDIAEELEETRKIKQPRAKCVSSNAVKRKIKDRFVEDWVTASTAWVGASTSLNGSVYPETQPVDDQEDISRWTAKRLKIIMRKYETKRGILVSSTLSPVSCSGSPRRGDLKNILKTSNFLASLVVIKINDFWRLMDYNGPKFKLADILKAVTGDKIEMTARCLLCDEYYAITTLGTENREFSMLNYSKHASRHILFEDKGIQANQFKPESNQLTMSSFFKKVEGQSIKNQPPKGESNLDDIVSAESGNEKVFKGIVSNTKVDAENQDEHKQASEDQLN